MIALLLVVLIYEAFHDDIVLNSGYIILEKDCTKFHRRPKRRPSMKHDASISPLLFLFNVLRCELMTLIALLHHHGNF